jgi:hypothetical protein
VVVRFRSSVGVERQQLRWVAVGAVAAVAGLLAGAALPQKTVISSSLYAMVLCIPLAVAVAVLRYRLWDLDRLISRTLTYTLVTALLVVPYLLIVPAAGRLVQGSGSLAVAAATLATAAAFAPLRRRVQGLVDRRFNRRRYDAARTVEGFATRLRDQVDLDALSAELLAVVHHTMQPVGASLWLRPQAPHPAPEPHVAVGRKGSLTRENDGSQTVITPRVGGHLFPCHPPRWCWDRPRSPSGRARRCTSARLARTHTGNQGGATVARASSRTLEDVKVGVRCKLAALWIATLLLFAYGDIFGFFRPGQLQEVLAGKVSGMAITQGFLLAVSLYVAVASVMVFLSLVLSPTVDRWANVVLAGLYVVSIVASAIGETSAYYWLLSITESALLLLIVWYAWTWPRQEGTP